MSTTKYVVLRSRNIFVPTLDNVGTFGRASSFDLARESIEIDEADLTLMGVNGVKSTFDTLCG